MSVVCANGGVPADLDSLRPRRFPPVLGSWHPKDAPRRKQPHEPPPCDVKARATRLGKAIPAVRTKPYVQLPIVAEPTIVASFPLWIEENTVVPYRCYFLDRANRIGGVHEIHAASDVSAMDVARTVLACAQEEYTAIEVWQGARKVDSASRHGPDGDIANIDGQRAVSIAEDGRG